MFNTPFERIICAGPFFFRTKAECRNRPLSCNDQLELQSAWNLIRSSFLNWKSAKLGMKRFKFSTTTKKTASFLIHLSPWAALIAQKANRLWAIAFSFKWCTRHHNNTAHTWIHDDDDDDDCLSSPQLYTCHQTACIIQQHYRESRHTPNWQTTNNHLSTFHMDQCLIITHALSIENPQLNFKT